MGQLLGIVGWLVESQIEFGSITVDTLQEVGPALTGQPCKQDLPHHNMYSRTVCKSQLLVLPVSMAALNEVTSQPRSCGLGLLVPGTMMCM